VIVSVRGGAEYHTHASATAPSPIRNIITAVASHGENPKVSINAVTNLGRRMGDVGDIERREKR
jgi:hypothetical protein